MTVVNELLNSRFPSNPLSIQLSVMFRVCSILFRSAFRGFRSVPASVPQTHAVPFHTPTSSAFRFCSTFRFGSVLCSVPFRVQFLSVIPRSVLVRSGFRAVSLPVAFRGVPFRLLPSSLLCPFVLFRLFRLAPSCSGIAAGSYVSPLILAEIETQQLSTVAN